LQFFGFIHLIIATGLTSPDEKDSSII